jgi:hypothetical protein
MVTLTSQMSSFLRLSSFLPVNIWDISLSDKLDKVIVGYYVIVGSFVKQTMSSKNLHKGIHLVLESNWR